MNAKKKPKKTKGSTKHPHGDPCKHATPKRICEYLVKKLLPSLAKLHDDLEELYADHEKVHTAVVRLEKLEGGTNSAIWGPPILTPPEGDPGDPNS